MEIYHCISETRFSVFDLNFKNLSWCGRPQMKEIWNLKKNFKISKLFFTEEITYNVLSVYHVVLGFKYCISFLCTIFEYQASQHKCPP